MEEKVDLSIVLACYNEAGHLEDSVRQIEKTMSSSIYRFEIIFVDDGSSDGTQDIIRRLCQSNKMMSFLFHEKNMGRGKSVTDGIRMAKGEVAGFIDIDLETRAQYIPWMVMEVMGGADVACARRIYKTRLHSFNRWILNRSYNFLVRNFLKLDFMDTETGCKFFNRQRIMPVLEEVRDGHWFWDTEIIARAHWKGLKIVEVPTLYARRADKKSTVRIIKDSLYYLRKIFWFRREMKRLKVT